MSDFNNKAALTELKGYKKAIDKIGGVEKMGKFWMGRNTKNWFAQADADFNLPNLPDRTFSRRELTSEIDVYKARSGSLSDTEIRKLIVMIFAWGGMFTWKNIGKLAMDTIEGYEGICRNLLEDKQLSPVAAYEQFFEAWKARDMMGVGPDYYTKLIYLLGHQEAAIMDQWTAKAVNLLSDKKLIKLDSGVTVAQGNDKEVYEKYLDFLRQIQAETNMCSLSNTEELIYSCSYKKKDKNVSKEYHKIFSAWRKYVDDNV